MKLTNQFSLGYPKATHKAIPFKFTVATRAFTSFPQNLRLVTTNTYI